MMDEPYLIETVKDALCFVSQVCLTYVLMLCAYGMCCFICHDRAYDTCLHFHQMSHINHRGGSWC